MPQHHLVATASPSGDFIGSAAFAVLLVVVM